MVRVLAIVCVCLFFWVPLAGAAEGISNALLNVPSAGVLGRGELELSPTYKLSSIFAKFNSNSKIEAQQTEFSYRLTVGVIQQFELGINIPLFSRFENGSTLFYSERFGVGGKWGFLTGGKLQMSVYAGVQFPVSASTHVFDVGLVGTWRPTSWAMLDVSVTPSVENGSVPAFGIRYDVGFGAYVIPEKLQLMVEWSHELSFKESLEMKGRAAFAVNWDFMSGGTFTAGVELDLLGVDGEERAVVLALSLAFVVDTLKK